MIKTRYGKMKLNIEDFINEHCLPYIWQGIMLYIGYKLIKFVIG